MFLIVQQVVGNTKKPFEEGISLPGSGIWQILNFIALGVIIFLVIKILIKLSKNK